MNHLLVSPAQHQIHHSTEPSHIDRNFGMVLAIWDWMFATIYVPRGREPFTLGLQDAEHGEYSTIWALYALPFRKIARRLRRRPEQTASFGAAARQSATSRRQRRIRRRT